MDSDELGGFVVEKSERKRREIERGNGREYLCRAPGRSLTKERLNHSGGAKPVRGSRRPNWQHQSAMKSICLAAL
jgi:hypothetical protein